MTLVKDFPYTVQQAVANNGGSRLGNRWMRWTHCGKGKHYLSITRTIHEGHNATCPICGTQFVTKELGPVPL